MPTRKSSSRVYLLAGASSSRTMTACTTWQNATVCRSLAQCFQVWEQNVNPAREGLKSLTLEAQTPLSLEGWKEFIGRILSRPGQVLRVKGYVSLEAHPQRLLLHAVRDLISVDTTGEERDGMTRLVMIGRDLDPKEERAAFARLSRRDMSRVVNASPQARTS